MIATMLRLGSARLLSAALGFALTLLVSRLCGVEALGTYTLIMTLLGFLSLPIGRGWGTLIMRQVSALPDPRDWRSVRDMLFTGRRLSVAYTLALLLAASAGLVALDAVGLGPVPLPHGLAYLGAIGGLMAITQASEMRVAVLRGLKLPSLAYLPEMILRPVVFMAALVLCAALVERPDVWLLLASLGLASLASLVAGEAILRRHAPSRPAGRDRQAGDLRQKLSQAVTMSLNSACIVLLESVDVLLLGILAGVGSLGQYKIALQFALLAAFAYTTLNLIAGPLFSEAWSRRDLATIERISGTCARACAGLAAAALVLGICFGESLIALLFGPQFLSAFEPLVILLCAQVMNASFGMPSILLTMAGFERSAFRISVQSAALAVGIGLLLVPALGPTGAALCLALSQLAWRFRTYRFARRALGVDTAAWKLDPATRSRLRALVVRLGPSRAAAPQDGMSDRA